MLKLKRYSFSGIGRFVQKQTIDLENRSHLIQIDGENTNTGGSSGSGKSTTAEALAYLFGINEIPTTQLQSRITKDSIWVEAEFEGGITISRSKKDGLTIKTPEETVSGSSKLAEEKLDEIIGVKRELLAPMCYKRQKQGGFFLNLTPKQSHDFLVDCLDLNHLHNKTLKIEDILKNQYKPQKIRIQGFVESQHQALEQLNSLLQEKKQPEPLILEPTDGKRLHVDFLITELESVRDQKTKKLTELGPAPVKPSSFIFEEQDAIEQIKNQILKLKDVIAQNLSEKEQAVTQANSAIYKIESKIREIKSLGSTIDSKQKRLNLLNGELQHIVEQKCPTCLKKWDSEGFEAKKISIEQEILQISEEINSINIEMSKIANYELMLIKAKEVLDSKTSLTINVTENEQLNMLQEELRVLNNKKDNLATSINESYLEKHKEWTSLYQNISSSYDLQIRNIEQEIAETNNKIQYIEMQRAAYDQALKTYESDIVSIKTKIESTSTDLIAKQKELNKIEKDTILAEESIRLIKHYTLQKFQDTLDYIGQRATEIINNIPNMSNAVIYFENAKETKSGNIKNEVNAVINLEGDSAVPIKTLSGGERTSADFAIDLAVSEMIEGMTQKGVNFLIIDEGFDGLDSISKIQCLEILKSLDTNKKIIIVDHSSEVKEMVYDIIKVKRIKEESIIDD
jgi:DNA repair exonuclease SbcCD ATPase subunit